MWLPERVWEQQFTRDIADAGIEFLILDDYHFRAGGLRGAELRNYYLTEDEGKMLALFPGDEQLRYLIPFQKPEKTIEYLRRVADERPGCVVTFGDDGEKFGTWPGTKESVYGKGWLRSFFDCLVANKDWLTTSTLAEAFENVAPMGKFYVPDCSYREMTEWALPAVRQTELHDLSHAHAHDGDWPQFKQYLRGGFWRNFRVKYPEANEMYCRMLQVSDRLDEASNDNPSPDRRALLAEARTHLYKAQCNCPYWHGAFGGLYLPHLRNAVYSHLIQADTLLEKAAGKGGRYAEADAADYDLDGRVEVKLTSDRLVAFLKPSRGGHLYELDVRGARHNLLATLDRRPEPYHDTIRRHVAKQAAGEGAGGEPVSIHDLVRFKQPDLDKRLGYDAWPRKSLVDHFLMPGLSVEEFRRGEGQLSDFPCGVYETTLRRSEGRAEAAMSRTGHLSRYAVRVEKTVAVLTRNSGTLEVTYALSDLPANRPIHFAVELNFAGMAAGQPDRYFYDAGGRQIGQLQERLDLPETDRLGLVDEWLGLDASVDLTEPAGFWTWPVETISQSEAGFEAVHQSTVVVPHWEFVAPSDGRWAVTLTLTLDTSAAQAKQLSEPAMTVV
jgi:alpha-amylase